MQGLVEGRSTGAETGKGIEPGTVKVKGPIEADWKEGEQGEASIERILIRNNIECILIRASVERHRIKNTHSNRRKNEYYRRNTRKDRRNIRHNRRIDATGAKLETRIDAITDTIEEWTQQK